MLVHLRYLAVWSCGYDDSSFLQANFLRLETLIVKGNSQSVIYSSKNIVNLSQLCNIRHLRCDGITIPRDFTVPTLSNLQTISRLILDHKPHLLLEYFSNIKKLGCSVFSTSSNEGLLSFAMLTHLEALNIDNYMSAPLNLSNPIRFPETLKKLTLKRSSLPWNYMSTIQRLPKLEVLQLLDSSFTGYLWETGDEQFHQLKYLKLTRLNIRVWEASRINFPRLRKLAVRCCKDLREIPLVLGNISTLEYINIDHSNSRVLESVNRIQNAQRDIGTTISMSALLTWIKVKSSLRETLTVNVFVFRSVDFHYFFLMNGEFLVQHHYENHCLCILMNNNV